MILLPAIGIAFIPYFIIEKYTPEFGSEKHTTIAYHYIKVMLPSLIGSFFMMTIYDKVVFWAQDYFGWNED